MMMNSSLFGQKIAGFRFFVWLILLGGLFLFLRSLYLFAPHFSYLNQQESLFGLDSLLLKENFSLESLCIYTLGKLIPLNVYVVRMVPLFFSLCYFLSLLVLVRIVYQVMPTLFLYVAFFFLLPPFFFSQYSLKIGSDYMVNLFLGNIVLCFLYRFVYIKEPLSFKKEMVMVTLIGLLCGLILSNHFYPINASYIFFVLLLLLFKKTKARLSINLVVLLSAFLAGLSFVNVELLWSFLDFKGITFFKIKNLMWSHLSAVLGVYYIYWVNYPKNIFFVLWKVMYLYLFCFIGFNGLKNSFLFFVKGRDKTDKSEFFFLYFLVSSFLFISFSHLNVYMYLVYASVPVLLAYFFYDLKRESKSFFLVLLILTVLVHGVDHFYFFKYNLKYEHVYRLPNRVVSFLRKKQVTTVFLPKSIRNSLALEMVMQKEVMRLMDFPEGQAVFNKQFIKNMALITSTNYGLPTPEQLKNKLNNYIYQKETIGDYVIFYDISVRNSLR